MFKLLQKENLKCRHCNVSLYDEETVDEEYYDYYTIFRVVGHCPKCGRKYQWKEVHHFIGYENLEEDE